MFVYGLYTTITNAPYIFLGKTFDLNKIVFAGSIDEYERQFVSMDIDVIIDVYAETKHKQNGVTTVTEEHYIVCLYDDSFISLSTDKNFSEFHRVIEQTYDFLSEKTQYLTDQTVYVEGRLKPLKGELSGYYQEVLNEWGLSIMNDNVHLYTVDTTESRLSLLFKTVGSLIAGLLLFVIAFIDKINQLYFRKHNLLDENNKEETDTLFIE